MPSIFTLSGPKRSKTKKRGLSGATPGELHLVMVNEGSLYRELQDLRSRGVALACKAGRFDRTAIAQLFTDIAQREASKLDRRSGGRLRFGDLPAGAYSKQVMSAALEFADSLKTRINICKRNPWSCDLPAAAAAILKKGCRIPPDGFAGAKRRRR